jgi:hypothetical protein
MLIRVFFLFKFVVLKVWEMVFFVLEILFGLKIINFSKFSKTFVATM